MKKATILFCILVLALSLVGCGMKDAVQGAVRGALSGESNDDNGGDSGGDAKIDANAIAQNIAEDAIEHNSFSLAAAEAFWKSAGININDAAPDWEWTVNEEKMATYGDKLDTGYGHASILFEKKDGSEISEEEFKAFAKKVFDATAAASDNGHNIIGWEFVGENEDALGEVSFERAYEGWLQGWGFLKGGRNMVVYLGEAYDTEKDSTTGRMFYYYGASADIAYGMEKSMDELLKDLDDAFEQYEDEIKDALEQYSS